MKYEKTLVVIKPGVLERKIVGEIIARFEKKGLDILACKLVKMTKKQIATLYSDHVKKDFFEQLTDYMSSGYCMPMVIGGINSVGFCRALAGATDPQEAATGTIRGDFALIIRQNIVHASDSAKNASKEIKVFFTTSEIRKDIAMS